MTRFLFEREAGILLHPTSLPGAHGIGDLGAQAHRWLQRLADAGQSLWQILPLNPPSAGASPYTASSAHAGNPLLISIETLCEEGLLRPSDMESTFSDAGPQADFEGAASWKRPLLTAASGRFFRDDAFSAQRAAFDVFAQRQNGWLRDFARFVVLHEEIGGGGWNEWPAAYRDRQPDTLAALDRDFADSIRRVEFEQFVFDRQWRALRERAHDLGIRIIGDLPIFVALDSAEVWAHRELFRLDEAGKPTVVAGVPPDYFSETGQLWGNPLYAWERHAADGFAWWRERVRHLLDLVDVARVDHFRGFAACWEIPGDAATAQAGHWADAPGRALFEAIEAELGRPLPLIAEDLGVITDDVHALRDEFELPGLRVLQFAFGDEPEESIFLPHRYIRNCVAYTGTHDNDTLMGWLGSHAGADSTRSQEAIAREHERIVAYVGGATDDLAWSLMARLFHSAAGATIVPLQDVLGLGSDARMNVPGRATGNWGWRLSSFDQLEQPWPRLAELTRASGRGLFRNRVAR